MRLAPLPCFALALLALVACGDESSSTTAGGGEGGAPAGCADVTNVSDGPTSDSIGDGATSIVCYYASPAEGYCRKITDSAQISGFYGANKDKGAIGCKDAVILTDAECPTKNAVGRCADTSIEAERLYYSCSKFADPAGNCAAVQGTYTAL